MAAQKRIGWWMDQDTCICCDRHIHDLKSVYYVEMRPNASRRKEPHTHNTFVMLCEICFHLVAGSVAYIKERMHTRLKAWRENCRCHTFFETQSNTPIAMMHSRS